MESNKRARLIRNVADNTIRIECDGLMNIHTSAQSVQFRPIHDTGKLHTITLGVGQILPVKCSNPIGVSGNILAFNPIVNAVSGFGEA